MVSKITSPVTPLEEINKINEIIDNKQDNLVSGTNIKTVNNSNLLGSGNIAVGTVTSVNNVSPVNGNVTLSIPTVNNATLTITQGGTTKGTFTANASSNVTIDLDAGGGSSILEALYPVGSIYITTANTCPLSTLISGSTWTLRSSGVVTSVNTSVPVKGTGMTLGLTNGTTGLALQDTMIDSLSVSSYGYGKNVGISAGTIEATNKVLGITTDPDKSGIVGTVTRTTLAVNIFERTA